MNVNDFLLPPNNKAKSVKLNARNLQDLQKVTATLSDKSREMEEKLQQLKDSMSKEKEERGLKWASGQYGSLSSNLQVNNSKKLMNNKLQKQLSAGKVRIRVLKDEPLLTVPPQPPPPVPTLSHQTARKSRLKGTICGQCEVRTAGVMCPECTENYCIGCFSRFHQKGALKLHRMVPIQGDLQTHVNSQDIAICLQKTINPSFCPSTAGLPNPSTSANSSGSITPKSITRHGVKSSEKGRKAEDNHIELHSDYSQALNVDHGEKKQEEMIGSDKQKSPSAFLRGQYNEEESARSFQEAVRQWRGERRDGGAELMTDADAVWMPTRPASVSTMATQADLTADESAQGQRIGECEGRVTAKVEFSQNSLTYADRLLLKKYRRTPVEIFDSPVPFSTDLEPPPTVKTEENSASSLTAEEEDFRHYWASLFDAPVIRGRAEPQITTPESCLVIEVLDETYSDIKHARETKQRTETSQEVFSVQRITRRERPLVLETCISEFSDVHQSSSSGPSQTSRASCEAVHPETAGKLLPSKHQASQALRSPKSPPSKSKPSACSTTEASGTSKASIRTPASKSRRSICSPTVHKSKAKHGSPQFSSSLSHSQSDIPKSSHSPILFSADALASSNNKSAIPEEHLSHSSSISFSLRSTFTFSPLSSTESTLLPKVYHSVPLQEGSDSSVLPDVAQTSPLYAKPISSPEPPRGSPMPQQQSQPSLCDQQPLPSDKPLQRLLSHVSINKHPPPKSLEPRQSELGPKTHGTPEKSVSRESLFSESLPHQCYTHCPTPTNKEVLSPAQDSEDHISASSHRDAYGTLIPSCQLLNTNHKAALPVKVEEEQEESIESGDEMSDDSLGLTLNEEDSSEEEALMKGYSMRARTKEEQKRPAISQLQESFVPPESVSESQAEMDYQTDKPEQRLEPSMVMHKQGAGPGSQQFCDLNGLSPLGLDLNSGDFDTPEHTHCDPLHTCQRAPHDMDPTGSESRGSCRSLKTIHDQHLAFEVMEDNNTEPTGVEIHSTRESKISLNEPGTSDFDPAPRLLSQAAQEIKEVCGLDQTGCEDPDLDTDTTAHILYGLEQPRTEESESLVCGIGNSGNPGQPGNRQFIRSKVSDEQEEEAEKSDRRSVLLLP